MNTHEIELPEHDCIYETTNESGFIDVEPAYRKSTVLRMIEADRKRRGIIVNNASASSEPYAQLIVVDEDDMWPQLVYLKGVNLKPGVHDLFLTPQPSETNKGEPVAWLRNERGGYEGKAVFDPLVILGGSPPTKTMNGATYSPVFLAPQPAEPEPCFCDRMYPDSNPDASCGDCPTRDYMKPVEPVRKTDWNNELSSWSDEDFIHIFHERPDLANRLRKMLAEPVKVDAEASVPSDIERMAVNRYRLAPDDIPFRYKVVAGDGTRALYHGTKDGCYNVARKLTGAFLDGVHVTLARYK